MSTKVPTLSTDKPVGARTKRSVAKPHAKKTVGASLRDEVVAFRKGRILQAACDAFYEHGYHECTVDMIADRLSGTKAIVYYYFPDKHSILYGIYCHVLEEIQALLKEAAAASEQPDAKLMAVVRAYARWVMDNHRFAAVYWREVQTLSAEARLVVAAEQKVIDSLVVQIVHEGVASKVFQVPDVHTSARAIAGMIAFIYTGCVDGKHFSHDEAADAYAQIALRIAGYRTSVS